MVEYYYRKGPLMSQKIMNHGEYQKSLKNKSFAELMFIVKDAREAAHNAQQMGCPNEGYYLDEIHYASAEMRKRQAP